ncbi:hypothetical protein [Variovorax paradoxus]|uniref:Uncharacterized protein n=1 Tax=Variovorax paradoxus TaxID=34073 RepID=A0A0H2M691_VARPD|nr:hypothetical protein [Variovorax paradoxus]KLN57651.1 hypothetical protein VPARA_11640 [Variovorax paradoxus]
MSSACDALNYGETLSPSRFLIWKHRHFVGKVEKVQEAAAALPGKDVA